MRSSHRLVTGTVVPVRVDAGIQLVGYVRVVRASSAGMGGLRAVGAGMDGLTTVSGGGRRSGTVIWDPC